MLNMHLWHIHYSPDLALHLKSVAYKLGCHWAVTTVVISSVSAFMCLD